MSEEEIQAIVIDNGSSTIKTGFADEEAPRSIFPSVVGLPKKTQTGTNKGWYVGDEACAKAGILILKYPIERGIVNDWDDMEKIWFHSFYNELCTDPAEHPVLLTEPPFNPKNKREKMIKIMFETFDVPAFYVSVQGVISIYSSNHTTGVVFDSGDGISQIIPICEGSPIPSGVKLINFAGDYLNDSMMKLLHDSGCTFTVEKEIASDIKKKKAYVALDYEAELLKAETSEEIKVNYELPDGQVITLNKERFMCPELLFKPSMNGIEADGIDRTTYDSIMSCDTHLQKNLYANIVLSGGNTMFMGLKERMEKEIKALAPTDMNVKVIALPDRKYAVWKGGSVFASLSTFPQMAITREEYNEAGPSIIRQKCPAP